MSTDPTKFFEFFGYLDNLKHLKRTGWVHFKVPEPETVACHQYRMAVLAMTLNNEQLDTVRCMKMSLVHDIGEAIIGDITPRCGILDEEKRTLEENAVKKISDLVPHLNNEIFDLWCEYEAHETNEAIAVKQLDKIDMLAQALTYEKKHGIMLDEFFKSTVNVFSTEPFIQWDALIRQEHEELKRKC